MKRETLMTMNIALALVLIGLVMAYSAGIGRPLPGGQPAEPLNYLKAHGMFAILGLCLMLFAARLDYHFWQARPVFWLLCGASLVSLLLVLVVGDEVRGARRWIDLAGVSFQPSESAKLALIIALAVKLAENQTNIPTRR